MTLTASRILCAVLLTLALAGCNRNPAENTQSQVDATPQVQPAPAPAPAKAAQAPAPIPPSTELQVQRIDSVMLSRPPNAPGSIVIRVAGTVVSPGWTEPKLSPVEDPNAAPSIKIFSLVATSPSMPEEARAATSVETELTVGDLPPEVKTIRVVSATNAVAAPIAQ
jgi:hypothetical protein